MFPTGGILPERAYEPPVETDGRRAGRAGRKRIEIERQRVEKEKQKAEKEKQRADSMFAMLVRAYRKQGKTKQEAVETIAGQTGQSVPETEEALNRIWE